MKKTGQIIIITLLAINLVLTGFMYVNSSITSRRIDDFFMLLDYELSEIDETVSRSIIDASLLEGIKVVNIGEEITSYNKDKNVLTGTINFDVSDNTGIDKVYVVMDNLRTGESARYDASANGNLSYTAPMELEYASEYEYYVIGENEDKSIYRLSLVQSFDTFDIVSERAHIHVGECSHSRNVFSAEGIVFYNEDIVKVEKIEAVISGHEESSFMEGEERYGEVLDTIDITDELFSVSELDYDIDVLSDTEYEKYAFRVASTLNEGSFNDYNFVDITIVFYFEDGTTLTLFQ